MSEARKEPDLRPLEANYEILSELRDGDDLSTYIARSRSDGAEVEIAVVRRPPTRGGDNNALAHFASDTQLLSTLSHPNVPHVIGGQWLGTDAFAVVRERVQATSLNELLSSDEHLPNAHIAAVLQDVNGVLEWARETGVVHRGVTPTTLLFEQRSNRVQVSLAPTPIPIDGVPDAVADARTVAGLAWRMLTGEAFSPDTAEARLTELRPELAARVRSELISVAQSKSGGPAPDVNAFISVIAMADALREGELEIDRLRKQMAEEQALERQKWEAEQRACEVEKELEAKAFAAEREKIAAEMAAQRDRIAAERADVQQMQARLKEQFTALDARRVDTERLNAKELERLAAVRAEFEQLRADQEQRNYEEAAKLRESAALLPLIDDDAPRESKPVTAAEAESPVRDPGEAGESRRRWWFLPGATGAGIILLAAMATAISYRSGPPPTSSVVASARAASKPMPRPAKGGFLSQSPGSIAPPFAPPTTATTAPTTPPATDSAPPVAPAPKRRPRPQPAPEPVYEPVEPVVVPTVPTVSSDSIARSDSLARRAWIIRDSIARDSAARSDSILRGDSARRDSAFFNRDSILRRDSLPRRDSIVPVDSFRRDSVRRDSAAKRDSVVRDSIAKRDSIRRDSLARVRPDSIRPPGH